MKLKYFLLIVIVSILLLQGYCQRGGGGGRSSFGGSRSYGRGYTGSRSRSGKPVTAAQTFLALGFFGILGVFWAVSQYKKGGLPASLMFLRNRKKQIKKVTDQFQLENQSVCILTQEQRNRTIDWFMGCQWRIQYKTRYSPSYSFDFTMKDLHKRSESVYDFEAEGSSESLGDSKINGVLMFKDDYLTICFDKLYNDRKLAGQYGKFDLLIYKGTQQGETFGGEWFYQGFQEDDNFSGEMRMIHN